LGFTFDGREVGEELKLASGTDQVRFKAYSAVASVI
jgi:hypothetical protein